MADITVRGRRLLALTAATGVIAALAPLTGAAAVTETQVAGNASCKQLLDNASAYEVKVETAGINNGSSYGPVTFTGVDSQKLLLGFTSTARIDAVFVKGGPDGGRLYDYRGDSPPGSLGDSKMGTNGYGQGRHQISHVSFCWNAPPTTPPQALTATKTAVASYDRAVTWDLTKSASPGSHTGQAGQDAGSSTWAVTASKNVVESNRLVTGAITVTNPNAFAVPVTVTDTLDEGTVGAVSCPATSVAASSTLTCTYTASPTGVTATSNNAVVTSGIQDVPGATAMAPVNWTVNRTGDESVTLADPPLGVNQQISGTTSLAPVRAFSCPDDPSQYTNGSNSRTETNTATLTGPNTNITRTADVRVDCSLPALTATKTAAGSFDRVITWSLNKTVDRGTHTGQAGLEAGQSTWSVTATKTVEDLNHTVSGAVEVGNPAAIAQTFTLEDVLSDGTRGSVVCPTYTLPAGGSTTCTYTAATATATLNTATVTAPGNAPVDAPATVTYTGTTIGDESVTLTDPRFEADERFTGQTISATTTLPFLETFSCPGDASAYSNGSNSRTEDNRAILVGEATDLTADASVRIDCSLAPLTAVKTAAGSYDRTVSWGLTKTVDPASHTGEAGQVAGSSTWSVTATKSAGESNNRVTGEITITNPAAVAVPVTVTDVLNDGTEAAVNCPATAVPAKGSLACSYTASPTGRLATVNTATVTGAGNPSVSATAAVAFTPNVIGDEMVTLADPRFTFSRFISTTTPVTFPETFRCPSDATQYTNGRHQRTESNTATLTAANTGRTANAAVTVDCRQWLGETATGAGKVYPGSSNWFMYTPYTTSKVDLIAGQKYDAGDIYMTRSGTTTNVRIVLHNGFRWAEVAENLKIQPFDSEPKAYVDPGAFKHKFKVSGSEVTVSIPNSGKAKFFGIHGDVERRLG